MKRARPSVRDELLFTCGQWPSPSLAAPSPAAIAHTPDARGCRGAHLWCPVARRLMRNKRGRLPNCQRKDLNCANAEPSASEPGVGEALGFFSVHQRTNLGVLGLDGLDPCRDRMTLLFVNRDPREIDWHSLEEAAAACEADCRAVVLSLVTTQAPATGVRMETKTESCHFTWLETQNTVREFEEREMREKKPALLQKGSPTEDIRSTAGLWATLAPCSCALLPLLRKILILLLRGESTHPVPQQRGSLECSVSPGSLIRMKQCNLCHRVGS